MKRSRPPSPTTVAVLQAIVDGCRHGFDIMDVTELPSGTVYPILGRLERGSLIRSRWEDPGISQKEKRPARKYYEMTAEGRNALTEGKARLNALMGGRAMREADA